MKVACVGGGPASLYFSIVMKRMNPSHELTVYERNPAGSTYGWGVTYWMQLLENLYAIDPDSAQAIQDDSVHWNDWVVHIHDQATLTMEHGDDGFGIGRRRLLDILTERARDLGVRVEFEHDVPGEDAPELSGADLVVAGDGINSALRERHAGHFGSQVTLGRNVYMWLGTTKIFESFVFSFVETAHGWIWCYGYPYGNEHSTCVVECAPATWSGLGLDATGEADSLAVLEKLFADVLDGHALIGRAQPDGSAHWLNFRTLTNRTWHRGNLVLLGDAAHTTHYSIGAGTALALGDAAVLAEALHTEADLEAALTLYERRRIQGIRPTQRSARNSARWYEDLPRYLSLPPRQMVALLGQRHSGALPHLPPKLYYRYGRTVEALQDGLHWLGGKLGRTPTCDCCRPAPE
ncbi:FAD-dependent monooxygenase [Actinomadura sp. ATCC 31491]|uniref:FAD-dependent monooxygenase n=1 Tax=Actinomadura luzonensis TaxID=2805427 RepID=A0ABT0FJ00_9ACTN|nr:FAD-dependent monooxygenase [Actinomadura luzonensis]MCK2212276.1 FAD-dependent monooxygenase [Actinomadura luzonensis]